MTYGRNPNPTSLSFQENQQFNMVSKLRLVERSCVQALPHICFPICICLPMSLCLHMWIWDYSYPHMRISFQENCQFNMISKLYLVKRSCIQALPYICFSICSCLPTSLSPHLWWIRGRSYLHVRVFLRKIDSLTSVSPFVVFHCRPWLYAISSVRLLTHQWQLWDA